MERIGFIPILFHLYARRGFEVGHDFVVNQVRTRSHKRGRNAHISVGKAHSPQGNVSCRGAVGVVFVLLASARIRPVQGSALNQVRMRVKAIGELAHQGRDDAHSHRECILQNCKAILGRYLTDTCANGNVKRTPRFYVLFLFIKI